MPTQKKPRGGARRGAGRPTEYDEPMEQKSVGLTPPQQKTVAAWAKDYGMSWPNALRDMLATAHRWHLGQMSKRR